MQRPHTPFRQITFSLINIQTWTIINTTLFNRFKFKQVRVKTYFISIKRILKFGNRSFNRCTTVNTGYENRTTMSIIEVSFRFQSKKNT